MPNVNLLPTISTATSNRSYFVVSDNGSVRRLKLENFIEQLQATMPGASRTDQNLFTSTNVTFRSINLYDAAGSNAFAETHHGFQSVSFHEDGTGLKTADFLGSLRFGGFDGRNDTILNNGLASAGINAVALEDWNYNGNTTTNSGAGLNFYVQPVDTQLNLFSRSIFLSAMSTSTNGAQPVNLLRLGSVISPQVPVNYKSTSSDGSHVFTSMGRTDMLFVNSRIYQSGVVPEDTSPINPSVTGTNAYTIVGSRYTNYSGYQRPLHNSDTLGSINFRGITTSSDSNGVLGGILRVHATTDYATGVYGTGMHLRTLSSSTGQLVTSLELQPEGNYYNSAFHRFADPGYDGGTVTITSGTVVFNDNSVQATAYQGFTSVPSGSNSAGTVGQMAYDTNYFYICVAPNRWKRITALDF